MIEKPQDTILVTLWHCADDTPPSRRINSVKVLGTIECEIHIPFSDLEEYRNKRGESFKILPFSVKMIPSGACIEFEVYCNGQKIGKSNTSIHFN